MTTRSFALLAALITLTMHMSTPPPQLPTIRTWAVFYGARAPRTALSKPDLLVLEPEHPWNVHAIRRRDQHILAYLSLGEVHASRPYYRMLANAPSTLIERNADWHDAFRIDPRSREWRHVLLGQVAPAIANAGYDGFFLDTVDVGPFLEHERGARGATAAMAKLITDLHGLLPQMRLVMNGGLELVPAVAGAIDGIAMESIFTAYDFKRRAYAAREQAQAGKRAARIAQIQRTTGLPAFVIEYVDPLDRAAHVATAKRVREAGFVPFVTDIGLHTLPP